jgi:hypothetical protein
MDEREMFLKRSIEETRSAIGEKIDLIESRIHQAVQGPKATIDTVVGSIDRVRATIGETKSAVDHGIDTIHQAVEDTMLRVRSTAKLIEQVQQEPWIMFASAILLGYVIGSLSRGEVFTTRHLDAQINESCRPETPATVAALP